MEQLLTSKPDDDPFDPNNWIIDPEPHRLYLNKQCTIWSYVDYDDYQWAIQWKWNFKFRRGVILPYAYRTDYSGERPQSCYLHLAILQRMKAERKTKWHRLGDHRDGNSLDNRRHNLRYMTRAGNARNSRSYDVMGRMSEGFHAC